MDENRIFDLLEKIYIEVQSHGKRLDIIENDVKKIDMKIDGDLIPTDKALLDGYKANSEQIAVIDDKLDGLQMDVNSISMKVSYNDNRIIEISNGLKKAK